jgi:hypothetical protein
MSASALMSSMLISTIGTGFFLYGKKQQRIPQLCAGAVLMIYPYFVDGAGWMAGIGATVLAALAIAVRAGL